MQDEMADFWSHDVASILLNCIQEQPDGTTVLTFHETYHAFNPVLRAGFTDRLVTGMPTR